MILVFTWIDDEHCEVYLGGHKIITMDHGPHGWDGMVGIQETLLRTAEIAGWTVRVFGESGI